MHNISQLPKKISLKEDCLKNKTVLITGAGDGIGKSIALAYAEYGAKIILLGNNQEKLESVYDAIESKGFLEPVICHFDLNNSDPIAYQQLAFTIDKNYGALDGLLHNAAILGSRSSIKSYKIKQWVEVFQVNFHSVFMLTQALLSVLEKSHRASVIFTSSNIEKKDFAYWGAYGLSKYAINGLMEMLANELHETSSVRANSINPGAVRTNLRAQAYPAENPIMLRSPDELISGYVYLMSDDSSSNNGKIFVVN